NVGEDRNRRSFFDDALAQLQFFLKICFCNGQLHRSSFKKILSCLVVIAVGPCGKSLDAMQSFRKYSNSSPREPASFSEEKRRRTDEVSAVIRLSESRFRFLRSFSWCCSAG